MPYPKVDRFDKLLDGFPRQRVLVLGDVMLDHYLWGDTRRISPEAPVPVIDAKEESLRLGGAANVAHNIRALGAEPFLVGLTGEDVHARELATLLEEKGISSRWIVRSDERRTTCKTRIVARNQQVLRVDREDPSEITGILAERTRDRAIEALDGASACVISDYGKGVITPAVLEPILAEATRRGLPVCVDPKETHFYAYKGVSMITPNQDEAATAYGRRIPDLPTLLATGRFMLERLQCRSVLITRGEQGMALFRPDEEPINFPAISREVFDVTGAGDTVVSVCALALGAGADLAEAAAISNHAAGLVIREVGTATASCETLRAAFLRHKEDGIPEILSSEEPGLGPGPGLLESGAGHAP